MDQTIKNALIHCIKEYNSSESIQGEELSNRLISVFEIYEPFLSKVEKLDAVFDDYPVFNKIREVAFDLLLMNFFSDDVKRLENDYLESDEWASIEDKTIDRGTELLNLLLYLAECKDEEIVPELDDFLREFLLVDEDEFQDEYHLYEPVIEHQILIESNYREIGKVASKINTDQDIQPIFYALMSFFMERNPSAEDLNDFVANAPNPAYDRALYQLLINFCQ